MEILFFRNGMGGMVMLTQYFRNKYSCTAACIEDVLDLAYGNRDINYVILGQESGL